MKPRKKKKKQKKTESLITRLIKGGESRLKGKKKRSPGRSKNGELTSRGHKAANGKGDEAKAKPLTALERSINEIKHMSRVGSNDPERLAMILSTILSVEQEKTRKDQEKFDNLVSDIVKRKEEEGGGGDSDSHSSNR